ncbi:hypothetical protein Hypma_007805 [Hypsizygus marmoreus]|uniref:Uncharacterized protein n=1 Tax=Hypsizygus marmoreus TaxID=39966 RepID=A0A369JYR5_HYPMA|nr:hypothetical protein Hypma_007805 [Hypsizygus marmoreus]
MHSPGPPDVPTRPSTPGFSSPSSSHTSAPSSTRNRAPPGGVRPYGSSPHLRELTLIDFEPRAWEGYIQCLSLSLTFRVRPRFPGTRTLQLVGIHPGTLRMVLCGGEAYGCGGGGDGEDEGDFEGYEAMSVVKEGGE